MKPEGAKFAHILKAKRKELGLSQIEVVQKLAGKMSIASYRMIEQGLPPSENARKILTNWLQS